jgi:metallo-beta-lactamase family protein
MLGRELTDGLAAGGNVIVPVFAVERTQEILRDIGLLKQAGQIAKTPVFLDSPLAGRTTEVFHRHRADLGLAGERDVFGSDAFHLTETVEQSKAISRIRGGAIILAGSGMCDGGRVKYHLKDNLWRPDSTILFVGYQAPGTLGSIILRGAPRVRIHGEEIAVKARIRRIEAYSGHADRDDLVEWARPMLGNLGTALLVHGEEDGLRGLAAALEAAGVAPARIRIPRLDQRFVLSWQDDRWVATPDLAFDSLQRLPPGIAGAHRDWHNDYAQA